jgi:tetratricopeptide (TPR) repeat protein
MDVYDEFALIGPEESGAAVAQNLRKMGGGAILVAGPDKRVMGSITWKDILGVVAQGGSPAQMQAQQIMSQQIAEINSDETLGDVIPRIAETYASAFVVTDYQGGCVGYFSPKDYRDALAQLGCYNKKHAEDDAEGWRDQGVALAAQGKTDDALKAFDKTLQLRPDQDKIWFDKAVALERSGRYAEALPCYDEVLKLHPRSHEAHFNKGNVYMAMGDMNGAIACYDQAINIMPAKVEAWLNKGAAHMRMSDFRPAIQSYDRALRLAPDSAEGWYNKGNCLDRVGDMKGAVEAYRKAVKYDPNHENSYYNMGAALHQMGKTKKAVEAFNTVLKINPANAGAREALVICKGG